MCGVCGLCGVDVCLCACGACVYGLRECVVCACASACGLVCVRIGCVSGVCM